MIFFSVSQFTRARIIVHLIVNIIFDDGLMNTHTLTHTHSHTRTPLFHDDEYISLEQDNDIHDDIKNFNCLHFKFKIPLFTFQMLLSHLLYHLPGKGYHRLSVSDKEFLFN
jgi:hypothetical protein